MGMGIPVICNDIGDTGRIISETKTGIVVNDFSLKSFQNAICKIADLGKMNKEDIRNSAKEIFDLHMGVQTYWYEYNRMLSKNN